MSALALRLLAGAVAGLVAAFVAINLGLRLSAEGRAFLAAARARGRLLAHPGPDTAPRVRAMFALAWTAAIAIGVGVAIAAGPGSVAPVPFPPTAALTR